AGATGARRLCRLGAAWLRHHALAWAAAARLTGARPVMISWPVAAGRLSDLAQRPEVFVWAALFAVGVWLAAGGLAQIRRRPSLADRLARLDVDARLEDGAQVRLGRTPGCGA